jgi:hypothetical protein
VPLRHPWLDLVWSCLDEAFCSGGLGLNPNPSTLCSQCLPSGLCSSFLASSLHISTRSEHFFYFSFFSFFLISKSSPVITPLIPPCRWPPHLNAISSSDPPCCAPHPTPSRVVPSRGTRPASLCSPMYEHP